MSGGSYRDNGQGVARPGDHPLWRVITPHMPAFLKTNSRIGLFEFALSEGSYQFAPSALDKYVRDGLLQPCLAHLLKNPEIVGRVQTFLREDLGEERMTSTIAALVIDIYSRYFKDLEQGELKEDYTTKVDLRGYGFQVSLDHLIRREGDQTSINFPVGVYLRVRKKDGRHRYNRYRAEPVLLQAFNLQVVKNYS